MHRRLLSLALVAFAAPLAAQAPGPVTVAELLQFKPGNAKAKAMLARIADLREIIEHAFSVALVDLDGDGRQELIVRAESNAFCGSGGCATLVLQQQGTRMVTLLNQHLFPGLAVTHEKVGGYRALAAVDDKGAIPLGGRIGTPLYGKPLVYPMEPPSVVALAQEPVATPGTSPSTTVPAPRGKAGLDVLGVRLGMPVSEALEVLKAHNPRLKWKASSTQFAELPGVTITTTHSGQDIPSPAHAGNPYAHEMVVLEAAPGPSAPVVTGIWREIHYAPGQEADRATVSRSLGDKYGPPTLAGGYNSRWHWDADGKPFGQVASCSAMGRPKVDALGMTSAANFIRSNFAQLGELKRQAPHCRSFISVDLMPSSANHALVSTISVYASDEVLRTARFQAMADQLERLNAASQKRQSQDAAGRGAPKF